MWYNPSNSLFSQRLTRVEALFEEHFCKRPCNSCHSHAMTNSICDLDCETPFELKVR